MCIGGALRREVGKGGEQASAHSPCARRMAALPRPMPMFDFLMFLNMGAFFSMSGSTMNRILDPRTAAKVCVFWGARDEQWNDLQADPTHGEERGKGLFLPCASTLRGVQYDWFGLAVEWGWGWVGLL